MTGPVNPPAPDQTESPHPATGLDDVVRQQVRLGILSITHETRRVEIGKGLVVGLLLAMGLAMGMAGCRGDGGGDRDATASQRTQQEQQLRWARCLRENGIPDVADPKPGEGVSLPEGADRATVDAAMDKCKKYAPNGGEPPKLDAQQLEQMRKYAQCMRNNGVENFPDPDDTGLRLDNKLGLDENDPKYQAAVEACNKYMPTLPGGGVARPGG